MTMAAVITIPGEGLTATRLPVAGSNLFEMASADAKLAVVHGPIEYAGETTILDPHHMGVEQPVLFRMLGRVMIAVRRAEGAIDVFYIP